MKNFTSFADAGDYKTLLQQALEIKANLYVYQHIGRNNTKQWARAKVALTWTPHVRALPQYVPNFFCDWFSEIDWFDFFITHPVSYGLDPNSPRAPASSTTSRKH